MDNLESVSNEKIKCSGCGRIIELPVRPTLETAVVRCSCGVHYELPAGSNQLRLYHSRKAWLKEAEARQKMNLPIPKIQSAKIIRDIEGDV